jgi:hypothetical protein
MLPLDIFLSQEPSQQRIELINMYRDISDSFNGTIKEFSVAVYGDSVAGVPTMVEMSRTTGVYFRQGIVTDVFFDVAWSDIDIAVGAVKLRLPLAAKRIFTSPWIIPMAFSGLTLSAGYTAIAASVASNSDEVTLYEYGSTKAMQPLTFAVCGIGGFSGTLRYIGKA